MTFFTPLRFLLVFVAAFSFSTTTLQAQDTIKVMYYNLLNFPDAGAINRQDTMERIFAHVRPDVLLVCELQNVEGANVLLNTLNTLGAGPYQRANFVTNQSSSNILQNMCFYRSDKLSLLSQDEIITSLRDINEYRLFQVDAVSSDTVFVDFYVTHLRASTGSVNEADREAAILDFKAHLTGTPINRYRVFGGDLNFYDSFEAGYQALLNEPPVTFVDPISRPGSWSNNSSFDDIHTQSTRLVSLGGGATGGMDDRFDHIVLSDNIIAASGDVRYSTGSYKTIGNDGSHFNEAINSGTNLSAPPQVISALYQSSDHLPVTVDLILNSNPGGPVEPGCGELFFSEYVEGTSNNKALEIYNPGGLTADLSRYSVSLFNNGASTPNSSVSLSGSLAQGETYQIVNSSASAPLLGLADITSGVTFFNGDDAIGLYKDAVLIDAIGVIGTDPGTNWAVGSGATSEYTLVRKPAVLTGQTDWTSGSSEWLVYPQDEFGFFGSHSADPCDVVVPCSITAVPDGLISSVGPTGVNLAWNPLDGAVKCEVNGRPAGGTSFAKIRGNVPPFESFVPAAQLNPGTTYQWKVRCACSLSPLVVTPFSSLPDFTWPALREPGNFESKALIYPVPATSTIHIEWTTFNTDQPWIICDTDGRTMASGFSTGDTQSIHVGDWPSGIYLLRNTGFSGEVLGKVIVYH